MPASFNPRALSAHVAVFLGTLVGWSASVSTGIDSLVLMVLSVGWLLLAARVVSSVFVANVRIGLLRWGGRPSPLLRPSLRPYAQAGGGIVVAFIAATVLQRATEAVAECNATVALLSAKAITDDSFIGLDKVSPMAYAAWWQRHGARLGTVHNGRVVWQEAH